MSISTLRAACAMLLAVAAFPAAAQDQDYPAIATGLAIPGGPSAGQRASIPAEILSARVQAAEAHWT